MTSPTPAAQKKPKKSKTTDPTVKLPKTKFPLLDDETGEKQGEKQGEIAAKPTNERDSHEEPVIDTKPDIFQITQQDTAIIVNYPNINARKEKESHIHDTLDALNGTRREENITQEMPPETVAALQRLLGTTPDQNKPRGSNYGRLAQDFTFPPRNKSNPNNSSNNNNNATASSSKSNGDDKEVDQDDLDKKEKARRRKSNLNAFAPEFTPISSASISVDANKSIDASEQKHDDDRKKKNVKKEKPNHEVNGDIEPSYQKKKRRSSQPLITSEAPPYGFPPNGYDHNAYYMTGPHTPYLPNHVEGTVMPNWEEFRTKIVTELTSRMESEFQKSIDTLTSEVKNTFVEHMPEGSGVNGKNKDYDGTILQKLQDQILQELRNHHQEVRTTHDQLIHLHEDRRLNQASSLQAVQDGDIQGSISQRHTELQNMHHDLQTELKTGFRELQNEYRNMLERQQQLTNEIKNSQALQSRLTEVESELLKLNTKNQHLTSENNRLMSENQNLKMRERHNDDRKRQQETLISELQEEITSNKSNTMRLDKDLELAKNKIRSLETQTTLLETHNGSLKNEIFNLQGQMRSLTNDYDDMIKENSALHLQEDISRNNEKSFQSEISDLNNKLEVLNNRNQDLERKISMNDNKFKKEEENLRKQLKTAEIQVADLQRKIKELEKDINIQNNEAVQLKAKNTEIEGLKSQINQFKQRVEDLENSRTELQQSSQKELASLRTSNQTLKNKNKTLEDDISNINKELENKDVELQHAYSKVKEYDSQLKELETLRSLSLDYEAQSTELKDCREQFDILNQKVKSINDAAAREISEKIDEVAKLNLRVQQLEYAERDLEYISAQNKDLTDRLEAETKKQIENNRSQKNASSASNAYSFGGREPRMNGIATEFEDRIISKDQSLYNNQPNGNLEQAHYNSRMKPPTEYNSQQQTFNQSPIPQHQIYIPQTQNSTPLPQYVQPEHHLSHNAPSSQSQLQAYVPSHQLHSSQQPVSTRSNTPVSSQKTQQKQDQLQQQQLPALIPSSQQIQSNQGQSTVKQESKTHSRQNSRSNNSGNRKKHNQQAKKKDRNRRNSTTDNPEKPANNWNTSELANDFFIVSLDNNVLNLRSLENELIITLSSNHVLNCKIIKNIND
ncbi:6959_t:CDS:2 [Scutellospora calospora]|uniref:6959_t:CDS:1 n=1 Tax=Scutellospora calospora TaxID=85575 RepID=A0ACA9KMR9_9GLOM|nr:6959_t:CDS:2 [Scutellospora calospora]